MREAWLTADDVTARSTVYTSTKSLSILVDIDWDHEWNPLANLSTRWLCMTSTSFVREVFAQNSSLIIDGALATELEKRGCDLRDELWSAKILIADPEVIRQVHLDYFLAGANIAITASYQASEKGLAQYRGLSSSESEQLIRRSVELAKSACDEVQGQVTASQKGEHNVHHPRPLLVAGSVGPYGAYLADGSEYTGAYSVSQKQFKDFHRLRMKTLVESGCDLLACETIPSHAEVEALCDLVVSEFAEAGAWISVTIDDSGLRMADGTPLENFAATVSRCPQILAVGVNCVSRKKVTPALRILRQAARVGMRLLAYPNSGETYDAKDGTWSGDRNDERDWSDYVQEWRDAGAMLIGGCCRTSPDDIRMIADAMENVQP